MSFSRDVRDRTPGYQSSHSGGSTVKLLLRVGAALCLITSGACNSAYEPKGPGIAGSIVARDGSTSIGGAPTIHVKTTPTEECGVVFLVRPRTSIFRRAADGRLSAASVADLTVGRQVTVWAEYVLDSCPGQSTAERVEILD